MQDIARSEDAPCLGRSWCVNEEPNLSKTGSLTTLDSSPSACLTITTCWLAAHDAPGLGKLINHEPREAVLLSVAPVNCHKSFVLCRRAACLTNPVLVKDLNIS